MDYVDFMLLKLIVLCVLAFVAGFMGWLRPRK